MGGPPVLHEETQSLHEEGANCGLLPVFIRMFMKKPQDINQNISKETSSFFLFETCGEQVFWTVAKEHNK
jgi:hypothetical protein